MAHVPMEYVAAQLLQTLPPLTLTCPTIFCTPSCTACWSDLTTLSVWVNQNRYDQHGQAVGQRRVRTFYTFNVVAWNALRAKLRPRFLMSPDLFGQLFSAPVERCACPRAFAECSVQDCTECNNSMEALVTYAEMHLVDFRGERIQADGLRFYLRARPDEWDVLRVGLMPSAELMAELPDCAICMQPMLRARHLSCGHGFHAACAGRWLRRSRTWPVCRTRQ